jgi:hypothetical protein
MTCIAVVQPALALGEVARNLERIEDLIRDAHREHSPAAILVETRTRRPARRLRIWAGAGTRHP